MKKILGVLLVCTLILVGCGKKDDKKNNNNNNNNNNGNNTVTAGESIDIKLESNSSTGFSWSYELSGDDAVVLASKYEEGEDCEGKDGCGGYEVYTVTATQPGHVTFNLVYSRPWEEDGYKLEANYEIDIDEKLNITETHSGSYFEK